MGPDPVTEGVDPGGGGAVYTMRPLVRALTTPCASTWISLTIASKITRALYMPNKFLNGVSLSVSIVFRSSDDLTSRASRVDSKARTSAIFAFR